MNNLSNQIKNKLSYNPYYGTSNDTQQTVTDMDHFPYTRFFRGDFESDRPIVFEREAGWRYTENNCYKNQDPIKPLNHKNICYESACSTVYPCYPSYAAKYSDREAFLVKLNNACVVEYR